MRPSFSVYVFVKKKEALRLGYYKDANGFWTVGYGHKVEEQDHDWTHEVITQSDADHLFEADMETTAAYVNSAVKVPLTQGQFDALVSFAFNEGIGRLLKSTLLKCLNRGDYAAASGELLRWDLADGVVEGGLKTRRQEEQEMFNAAAV